MKAKGGGGLPIPSNATSPLFRRLFVRYVWPQRIVLGLVIVCMALVAATNAGFTQIIKPIIDDIFVARNEAMLAPVALFALLVFATKGMASFGQAVGMARINARVIAKVQTQLYEALIHQDLAFFNRTPPASLVSRFVADANALSNALSETLTGFGRDFLTAVALISVMFYEDARLAVIALISFPLAIWPVVRIGARMRKISREIQARVGVFATVLSESFQGIRSVKAFASEDYEEQRVGQAVFSLQERAYKAAKRKELLHPIMETLGGFAIVAVILYGGQMVISGTKTPGSFFAFIFALLLAYEPIKRLARLNARMQVGLAAAARLFEVIDARPLIQDAPDARPLKLEGGRVELRGVSFAYNPDEPVLSGIDLLVEPGKRVALVGSSGAGKTTLLNLVPRFYDVSEGSVLVDGQDVRQVTLASLRSQISLVSQEILLFDDSVLNNIAYGKPSASREQIEEVARAAGAHDFIAGLPEGYDTQVGPRGTKLSGGQKQRIAIARALLKDAPILLLDEATSALDTESERMVQAALEDLMKGRSSIVIAHRLSTIVDADWIYVMEAGRIEESGTHEALLEKGGAYARLHALQFADEEDGAQTAAGS